MASKSSSPTKKPSFLPEKLSVSNIATSATPPPSTEDLLSIEEEIKRLIEKKREADLHLIDIEARIFASEELYNKETKQFGSIINGLEGYMGISASLSNNIVPDNLDPRKFEGDGEENSFKFLDNHPFSSTSVSHQRALAVHSRLVRDKILKPIIIYGSEERSSFKNENISNEKSSNRTSSKKEKQRGQQKKRKRVR